MKSRADAFLAKLEALRHPATAFVGGPKPATRSDLFRREPDRPEAPPSLDGIREIELDFETTGTRWWAGDLPGGCGVRRPDGSTQYIAWGHRGGGNTISEEAAKRWFEREVRDKRITNLSTGFEVQMARAWGVSLEGQGNEVSDVAHYAALIDARRRKFSLAALCEDYLSADERKVTHVGGEILDMSRAMDYPASVMAVRATADVRQVGLLKAALWPELDRLGLQRVRRLEDDVMYAACEMEWNALPIDVEKLLQWRTEVEDALEMSRREVALDVGEGFQEGLLAGRADGFLNPDSAKDMEALFTKLGLPITYTEPTESAPDGRPSFTSEVLSHVDHPTVKKIARQGKLLDLLSKYLVPWSESVQRNNGLLRFKLHQCRGDEHGTARGRFSASSEGGGSTPHQVMKPSKQRKSMGPDWILRELVIPPKGMVLISADAMQIEYRIFASYTGSKRLREAYKKNPMLQFHEETRQMIEAYRPGMDYDGAKTCNFLYVYGGGLAKLALQLGRITKSQFSGLLREFPMEPSAGKFGPPSDHPLLAETLAIKQAYDKAIPEVAPLTKKVRGLAKDRGWVMDCMGRRATFPGGWGSHAALNAVIQPSAAEVMKTKMVEVHRRKRELGLTPMLTLHDEWLGGCPDPDAARKLGEILNRQSFPEFAAIPILWDVKAGKDWASCTSELEAQFEGMGADGTWNGLPREMK